MWQGVSVGPQQQLPEHGTGCFTNYRCKSKFRYGISPKVKRRQWVQRFELGSLIDHVIRYFCYHCKLCCISGAFSEADLLTLFHILKIEDLHFFQLKVQRFISAYVSNVFYFMQFI